MQRTSLFRISLFAALSLHFLAITPTAAQSFTFDLDEVEQATNSIGRKKTGQEVAQQLSSAPDNGPFKPVPTWTPQILANSFADADDLHLIGEDVVFQMLLKAFCQHRPVVLTPDAIWLVISQQVSYCVNKDPEKYRSMLVRHEGKKELQVKCEEDLFSDKADWPALISGFTSEIAKYTDNNIATTLISDFSTTGPDERIASEVTLMDAVKPYFEYTAVYAICGIPRITIKGTPDDWRKVLEKTQALEDFGFGWWVSDLEPILKEFVTAAEGKPDYWFWKDIVMKTRPQTIQGPSCERNAPRMTEFDGWFLKFFPFDNDGRTKKKVNITQTMLPETVVVPFKYQVVAGGAVLSETPMELVAGIVGVTEDPKDFTLTPKIGWFARTANPEEVRKEEPRKQEPPQVEPDPEQAVQEPAGMEEPSPFNSITYPNGFAIEGHLGAGSEVFLDNSHLNALFGIGVGADFAINRFVFSLDYFTGRGGANKKDIPFDGYVWKAGDRLDGSNISLSLGYAVYDAQRWRVTPFAGIGAGFLTDIDGPKSLKGQQDEITGWRVQAGISVDYKFLRPIEDAVLDSFSEFSVKSRLFIARNALPAMPPMWTINLGVYFSGKSWFIKTR